MMNNPYHAFTNGAPPSGAAPGRWPDAFPGWMPGQTAAASAGAIMPPPTASGSLIAGAGGQQTAPPETPGMLPMEQSFIENILRLNLGKVATIYMTFENNSEWNAKIFRGVLEAAGRDHIIISDPQTGMRYLLLMVNLDYITFDEPLNYTYPLNP